ncbi:GDSL-motif lipase/hydrolase family protein [Striga asiatica]|uniref:GDSL-motif lipase/hydrolase family protein n=1 Tax=Striga asiatica TaxID=4170 RepID=A0A5A7R0P0_STRAF|nr:GDSL-motif lipase/hydrolase family protein [Striga asiatica]
MKYMHVVLCGIRPQIELYALHAIFESFNDRDFAAVTAELVSSDVDTDRGTNGAIEVVLKEVIEEVLEREVVVVAPRVRVVTVAENRLHHGIHLAGGARHVMLVVHHEPVELIGRHVIGTLRIPPERLPHVRRRLRLADLELPVETTEHLLYCICICAGTISVIKWIIIVINWERGKERD